MKGGGGAGRKSLGSQVCQKEMHVFSNANYAAHIHAAQRPPLMALSPRRGSSRPRQSPASQQPEYPVGQHAPPGWKSRICSSEVQ